MSRTISFTYKKTGKTYEMPWDKEEDPTPYDLADYVDKQENPTVGQRAGQAWSWLNQPLSDLPSRASKAISAPLWRYGENVNPTGYLGSAARGAAAMTESLGDVGSSMTSPLTLGLTALTGGAGVAERSGLARTAQLARGVEKGAAAGFTGQGLYETGKGIREGDPTKIASGALETGVGAFGLRSRTPKPTQPSTSTALARTRQLPTIENLGEPYSVTDLGPVRPPEPAGLPSINERGLPPATPTYYGGPVGGSLSTNINEVPTRSFAGGAGRTAMPARNWSGAQGGLRPNPSMQDVTPIPARDILPQTSPYGRIFNSAQTSELPTLEGQLSAPPELPPIQPEAPPQAQIQPQPSPILQDIEEAKPSTTMPGARPISQLPQDLREGSTPKPQPSTTKVSPKEIFNKLQVGENLDLPKEQDQIIRHAYQRGFITNSGDVEDFMSMNRDQYLDELGIGKGKTTSSRPFAKTDDASLKTFADLGDPAATQEIKFRQTRTKRATPTPQPDAFDRGEFERDAETYSHDNFVDQLKESLKQKPLKERLKGEKGAVFITKTDPEAKSITLKWARKMTAAQEWGQMAHEDVTANPGSAQNILGDMWTKQRQARLRPIPVTGTSPDEVRDYVIAAKKAIAQSEFHGEVGNKGWLNARGKFDTSVPEGKAIQEWVDNYKGKSSKLSNIIGGGAGFTKNIYLAGGVPGTPLNIHGYNIARSDVMARGVAKGTQSFAEGIFNPQANIDFVKANRRIIPEAMEHGFQWHGIEDYKPQIPLAKTPIGQTRVGKAVVGGVQKVEDWFEKPLFGRYLPATKLKFLVEKVADLQAKGISRDQALTQASSMSNNFYGGMEKALRDKSWQNNAKAILLAPDWFESRMRLAGNQLKSLTDIPNIMKGKSDPTYLQSLGRTVGMRLTKEAAIIAGGGSIYAAYKKEKPGEVTAIPAGTDVKARSHR